MIILQNKCQCTLHYDQLSFTKVITRKKIDIMLHSQPIKNRSEGFYLYFQKTKI